MKSINSSLFHRIVQPRDTTSTNHPTLILLHGRGADEEDLLGLSSYLDKRFLILSVRAPFPMESNAGFTWYAMDDVGTPDPEMFKSSYDKLSAFVSDALAHYPIDKKQLYLLGFSMGTVMSYALAFTKPSLFRGVVANSGYVAEGTHLSYQWNQLGNVEFFVTHGTQDPVIPVQIARKAKKLRMPGLTTRNTPWPIRSAKKVCKIFPSGLHGASTPLRKESIRWPTTKYCSSFSSLHSSSHSCSLTL